MDLNSSQRRGLPRDVLPSDVAALTAVVFGTGTVFTPHTSPAGDAECAT